MKNTIKTTIDWKTGKPPKDGEYIVVTSSGYAASWHYTTQYGWNTFDFAHDHAIEDSIVVCWTENYCYDIIQAVKASKQNA